MDRRKFIGTLTGAVLAAPVVVRGQAKVYRVGILQAGTREDTAKLSGEPFVSALAQLGVVEGRNLAVEARYADGQLERLPALAAEILATKPDLIFAPPSAAASAARSLTSTVPIVFCFVNDPVAAGFAQSLGRPGGNLTGLSNFSVAVAGKRIELLKELAPKLTRLCAWYNPATVNDAAELREVELAAARYGMQFLAVKARNAVEFDEAALEARNWNADAIYLNTNPPTFVNRKQIIGLVAALRKPAIYWNTTFVEDGGLIAYAVNFPDLARRAAGYAEKILRGAKPADLPIEQPTRIELVINRKTARGLGLTIPPSLLQRADQLIE